MPKYKDKGGSTSKQGQGRGSGVPKRKPGRPKKQNVELADAGSLGSHTVTFSLEETKRVYEALKRQVPSIQLPYCSYFECARTFLFECMCKQ